MRVRGREPAAVVDDDEVPVAAEPARVDDRCRRRTARTGCPSGRDVDALVHAAPAHAEAARRPGRRRASRGARSPTAGRSAAPTTTRLLLRLADLRRELGAVLLERLDLRRGRTRGPPRSRRASRTSRCLGRRRARHGSRRGGRRRRAAPRWRRRGRGFDARLLFPRAIRVRRRASRTPSRAPFTRAAIRLSWRPMRPSSSRLSSRSVKHAVPSTNDEHVGAVCHVELADAELEPLERDAVLPAQARRAGRSACAIVRSSDAEARLGTGERALEDVEARLLRVTPACSSRTRPATALSSSVRTPARRSASDAWPRSRPSSLSTRAFSLPGIAGGRAAQSRKQRIEKRRLRRLLEAGATHHPRLRPRALGLLPRDPAYGAPRLPRAGAAPIDRAVVLVGDPAGTVVGLELLQRGEGAVAGLLRLEQRALARRRARGATSEAGAGSRRNGKRDHDDERDGQRRAEHEPDGHVVAGRVRSLSRAARIASRAGAPRARPARG